MLSGREVNKISSDLAIEEEGGGITENLTTDIDHN